METDNVGGDSLEDIPMSSPVRGGRKGNEESKAEGERDGRNTSAAAAIAGGKTEAFPPPSPSSVDLEQHARSIGQVSSPPLLDRRRPPDGHRPDLRIQGGSHAYREQGRGGRQEQQRSNSSSMIQQGEEGEEEGRAAQRRAGGMCSGVSLGGPGWLRDIFHVEVLFDGPQPALDTLHFSAVPRNFFRRRTCLFEVSCPLEGVIRVTSPPGKSVWMGGINIRLEELLLVLEGDGDSLLGVAELVVGQKQWLKGTLEVPFSVDVSQVERSRGWGLRESYVGEAMALRHQLVVTVARPWYTFDVLYYQSIMLESIAPPPAASVGPPNEEDGPNHKIIIPDCHGRATFDFGCDSVAMEGTLQGNVVLEDVAKPLAIGVLAIIKAEFVNGQVFESVVTEHSFCGHARTLEEHLVAEKQQRRKRRKGQRRRREQGQGQEEAAGAEGGQAVADGEGGEGGAGAGREVEATSHSSHPGEPLEDADDDDTDDDDEEEDRDELFEGLGEEEEELTAYVRTYHSRFVATAQAGRPMEPVQGSLSLPVKMDLGKVPLTPTFLSMTNETEPSLSLKDQAGVRYYIRLILEDQEGSAFWNTHEIFFHRTSLRAIDEVIALGLDEEDEEDEEGEEEEDVEEAEEEEGQEQGRTAGEAGGTGEGAAASAST